MSISTEISRLQTDRNTIRAKLVELGMATNTDNLDKLATAIEAIINCGAVSVTVKEGETYTIPAGYHNGSGTVTITLETKTVTPTKEAQEITPTAGKVLSKVTVAAIPDNFIDTTDADAISDDILINKSAYVNGRKIAGLMPNNGDISATIDGITATSATIPAGYTSGGTVSLTSDIEQALAAI